MTTWVDRSTPFDSIGGLAPGTLAATDDGSIIVAGTFQNISNHIMFSLDGGETWTSSSVSPFDTINKFPTGICWAESLGLFVAVGYNNAVAYPNWVPIIATSADGDTWAAQTQPWTTGFLVAVGWSESQGLLVAGGGETSGGDDYMTSVNATAWSSLDTELGGSFSGGLIFSESESLWLASSNFQIVTSPDASALSWTLRPSDLDGGVRGFVNAPGQGKIYATGGTASPPIATLVSSDDGGETWVLVPNPMDEELDDSWGTIWGGAEADGIVLLAGSTPASAVTLVKSDGGSFVAEVNLFDGNTGFEALYRSGWVVSGVGTDDFSSTVIETAESITPPGPPPVTQYQRIYGWTLNISDDALETVDPMLTSPIV